MRALYFRSFCLITTGFLLAVGAVATSVVQLSLEELIDQSNLIVSGRITRSWTDWDAQHQYIWTHYEISVSNTHKGQPGSTVIISEPGGIIGDRGMTIAGTVSYLTGENVLVFLNRVPNGYLRTTGWGQGGYTVDEKGILHASSSLRPGSSGVTLNGMSISELHQRIASRLRGQQNGTVTAH
jgi:hypothetical protein